MEETKVKEVAVAMCAADMLLGEEPPEVKVIFSFFCLLIFQDKLVPTVTLKGVFYKWIQEHFSFNMIKLSETEISKFSGAVKKLLIYSSDVDVVRLRDDDKDTLAAIKYFFPGVSANNAKSKPLTNDQLLHNGLFLREFGRLWKWAQNEVRTTSVAMAQRAAAKPTRGCDVSREQNENQSKEIDEEISRKSNDSSKYVQAALYELSISKMKQWIELDDNVALRKKRVYCHKLKKC